MTVAGSALPLSFSGTVTEERVRPVGYALRVDPLHNQRRSADLVCASEVHEEGHDGVSSETPMLSILVD